MSGPAFDPPLEAGQIRPISDGEIVDVIRALVAQRPFHGDGYRKPAFRWDPHIERWVPTCEQA